MIVWCCFRGDYYKLKNKVEMKRLFCLFITLLSLQATGFGQVLINDIYHDEVHYIKAELEKSYYELLSSLADKEPLSEKYYKEWEEKWLHTIHRIGVIEKNSEMGKLILMLTYQAADILYLYHRRYDVDIETDCGSIAKVK